MKPQTKLEEQCNDILTGWKILATLVNLSWGIALFFPKVIDGAFKTPSTKNN